MPCGLCTYDRGADEGGHTLEEQQEAKGVGEPGEKRWEGV